jgi:type II restriction/modification system DNA methylase subunit YeeA
MAVCFIGTMKKAPFDVPYETGARWLKPAGNPNGRSNADVVFPWLNGDDITGRLRHRWIIDFGERSETEAAGYVAPFAHVLTQVKPNRITSGSPSERNYWWRLARRAPAMLAAISRFPRFLVTPRVAKHRLLFWLASPAVPDGQLVVIACDEDTTFGILHSRFHEAWALRLCTWLGVGNDPRYTPTTTFETFPFPPGLTPNIPAADYAENPHAHAIAAAARALAEARDRWLNPPDLMERVPEVVPGFPDRILPRDDKAAAVLKTRTLTNLYNTRGKPEGAWLDGLHAALDAAVAAAYGWPSDISDEDALARLLALNMERTHPGDACLPKVA